MGLWVDGLYPTNNNYPDPSLLFSSLYAAAPAAIDMTTTPDPLGKQT